MSLALSDGVCMVFTLLSSFLSQLALGVEWRGGLGDFQGLRLPRLRLTPVMGKHAEGPDA